MKFTSNTKLIAAIIFLLIAYWPLSSGLFTMKFDMMDWFYPMRFLIGECLQNHVLPVWNPYTNLGYPLHLDPQSGALYPPTWILGYFFGYGLYLINLEFLLHIVLAFWGMKKLSEVLGIHENIALLLGISYACCGFFIGNAQHLTWIISATWIPYVLWYYLKLMKYNSWKDSFGLSMFTFLLLSGGYPAFSITLFYLLLITFFIHVWRLYIKKEFSRIKGFLINNILFTFLFFIQILCFILFLWEGLPYIIREETLSLSDAQLLPFSPQSWLSFILPFTTGGDQAFFQTDVSMANGYFGLTGLIFCVVSLFKKRQKKIWLLWFSGFFFLILALGDFSFLRAWFYHYVPMMDLFRYPALFRMFSLLCFLLLFGFSMQDFWMGKASDSDWKKLRLLIILLMMALLGAFINAIINSSWEFPLALTTKALSVFFSATSNNQMILIQAPIQMLLLVMLLLITLKQKGHLIKYLAFIIILDLFLSVQLNTFLTVAEGTSLQTLQEKLDQQPSGFPITEKKISEVSHQGNGEFLPIWFNNNILKKQIAHDGYNNFKLKNFRAFKSLPNHMEILDHSLLYWNFPESNSNDFASNIQIEIFQPNYVKASVSNRGSGEIIFLQSDYPGWQVKLDGKEIEHHQKYDIFIATNIPKGNHQLEFQFCPKNYLMYLWISTGAFLCCLLVFFYQLNHPNLSADQDEETQETPRS